MPCAASSRAATSSSRSRRRATRTRSQPSPASRSANASPIPDEAPVTIATRAISYLHRRRRAEAPYGTVRSEGRHARVASMSTAAPDAEPTRTRLLAERFGLAEFRPGQAEVIEALLAGRSALAVFPTGAGKSLCYQLPALLLDGVTVVVSPLIALMKDQIDALAGDRRAGRAHRLEPRRSTSCATCRRGCERGELRLLYVAPERFNNERFLAQLAGVRDRALRGRRGALHLGVGPQLPPRLPQARAAGARARRRARAGAHGDRDARRGRRHLRGLRHRARRTRSRPASTGPT